MLYTQKKYLQFLLKASNQHGVHSPFVYHLVTKCFYQKINKNFWKTFLNAKKHTQDSKKNNRKKISKIGEISNKKAKLLIKIVSYFKPKNILEIRTSFGLGTLAIKIGNSNSSIITIEECPENSKVVQELFTKNNLNTIEILHGNFSKTLSKVTQNNPLDFIYFNGNYTKQTTLSYFNECLKTMNNESFFIFNDIYWNAEMQEAWSVIKNHSKVRVTVDVFYFGIVFFRKEQAKEHFKIRV